MLSFRRNDKTSQRANTRSQGQKGEELAAQFVVKELEWRILERNWRRFIGEIDLIARDPKGVLAFIEVKARQWGFEAAKEAVDRRKRSKVRRLAQLYLKENLLPLESAVRFDVLAIDLKNGAVEHVPDAFMAENEI